MLPLRSVGRSNFGKGLHILTTTLIQNDIIIRTAILYIYMNIYIKYGPKIGSQLTIKHLTFIRHLLHNAYV